MNNLENEYDNKPWYIKYAGIFFSFLSILLVFILIIFYYVINSNFGGDFTEMGQFGDLFGSLNALFSGLAFIGVLFSLFIQRKELDYTLQEMRDSTFAQEKSSNALEKQLRSIDRNNTITILQDQIKSGRYQTSYEVQYSRTIINDLVGEILKESKYNEILKSELKVNPSLKGIEKKMDLELGEGILLTFAIENISPIELSLNTSRLRENINYTLRYRDEYITNDDFILSTIDDIDIKDSFKLDMEKSSVIVNIYLYGEFLPPLFGIDFILRNLLTNKLWEQTLFVTYNEENISENQREEFKLLFDDTKMIK